MCKDAHGRPVQTAGGKVRVARQTQRRAGKAVSVITGLPLDPTQLAALCTELKRRCGAGGGVQGANIEIQGDHRDLLVTELQARGFAALKSGG